MGKRRQILADLEVYLSAPVGVGEHSDIGAEVENKLLDLDRINGLISTLQSEYPNIIRMSQAPTVAQA